MTIDKQELVKVVKEHAMKNYEKGWDVLVECYSDDQISEEIGDVNSVAGAIRKIAKWINVRKSYVDDIVNS